MKTARIYIVLLTMLLLIARETWADKVDDYVNQQIRAKHIPAMAVVVLRNGQVIKQKAYGRANLEFGVPAQLNDVFPLASITKVFSAVAVFLLVQDGKLRLDEKITSLLPSLPSSWNHVMVLNLLSHTSGIPDFPQIYDSSAVPASEEEALAWISSRPIVYETGTKSEYNQAEFLLLKIIVEKKSGMKFDEFLNRRIFVPAGITSARYGDSRDIFPLRVPVYTRAKPAADRLHSIPLKPFVNRATDPLFHSDLLFPQYTEASAGLEMTATDLAKLDTALHHGLLAAPLLRQMWAPFRLTNGTFGDFTAGWQYGDWNGHRMVGHIGAGMAMYTTLPDDNITLILLTNVQETRVSDLSQELLQLFVPGIGRLPGN